MFTFISTSVMFYQSFMNFNIPMKNLYSNSNKPIMQIIEVPINKLKTPCHVY